MLMKIEPAALAAGAIRVKYHGPYAFASLSLDVSSPTAPILALGVSDTDLAAAVTAEQTVITGDGTLNVRDVVALINNWLDTTASRAVLQGQFHAELYNAIYTDIFGGSSTPFETAAGTLQLLNTWRSALIVDDDATGFGYTSVMVPPPSFSHNSVAIKEIAGYVGTSGTPTVTRRIYDVDGNVLWSSGAITTATADELLKTFAEPVVFDGPVVVRDTSTTANENTGTTMIVTYGFPQAKHF